MFDRKETQKKQPQSPDPYHVVRLRVRSTHKAMRERRAEYVRTSKKTDHKDYDSGTTELRLATLDRTDQCLGQKLNEITRTVHEHGTATEYVIKTVSRTIFRVRVELELISICTEQTEIKKGM